MGARSRLCLLSLALLAPGSLLATAPAVAVGQEVRVIDLPTELRAQPRLVRLLGRSGDGHLVLNREKTPAGDYLGGSAEVLVAPDGTETTLDKAVDGVVGDRLVASVATSPRTVTSRLVGDSSWNDLAIPSGATYLDYVPAGVLVLTGTTGSRQLELQPWDGGPAVAVDGLPADVSVWGPTHRMGSGSLSLLWASSSSWPDTVLLLVDTAAHQAWPVHPANPDCQISAGELWGVNDGTLVWQSRTRDAANRRQLCTTSVPAPGAAAVVEPTTRPSVTLPPAAGSPDYDYRLLPVGDDVLVSSTRLAQPSWGADAEMPLVAVGPDGSPRTIRRWAYGVLPAAQGHVLAITGDAPGQERVQDLDIATGTSTDVLAIDSVPAWYHGIAVDGDRVVYADSSGYLGGVRQRTLDFAAGSYTPSTLLDTDAKGAVAAGAGAAAWAKSGWQGRYSAHLTSDGALTYSTGVSPRQTDDRWVMFTGGLLQDSTTGQFRPALSPYSEPILQDGVTYGPGTAVPGGPKDSVIATDAVTRQAAAIPVPRCAEVHGVQVAGSWMLVSCTDVAGERATFVVDRRDPSSTWRLNQGTEVMLGNGFVVARDGAGLLSWRPLDDPQTGWQTLGTAQAPEPARDDWAVSVSRGDRPTVAWYSGRSAHVALLPVATSPLPPHPTGIVPPSAPSVHLVAVDGQIRVYWDKPAAAEQITRFDVSGHTRKPGATYSSPKASANGTNTSATLAPVNNTASYDVTVTAWNIAGKTTSATVSTTPLKRPAAPTDVTADVNPVTSRATVTWAYTPDPTADPVQGFSVWMDGGGEPLVQGLAPDRRSASFVVEQPWQGALEVHADAAAQYGNGASGPVTFPGLDTTDPTAGLGGVPKVALTHRLTLTLTGSDDRSLATNLVDVRWRTGRLGQRLGPWTRPSSWQGVAPGRLPVSGLADGQTACFSVRAQDAAGNVSAWTAPRCTAVALDDRALTRSSGTRRITGSRYHRGGATVLGGRRTSLSLPGLVRDTGWLVASTCPTCGRVKVWVGRISYGSVSLHSTKPRDRVLLALPGPPRTGALRLVPTADKQRIVIDGLALLAH